MTYPSIFVDLDGSQIQTVFLNKQFVSAKKASIKYCFYLKGTCLDEG